MHDIFQNKIWLTWMKKLMVNINFFFSNYIAHFMGSKQCHHKFKYNETTNQQVSNNVIKKILKERNITQIIVLWLH